MANTTKTIPATDSPSELRPLVGDDATATFESDPKFIESNPTDHASSENMRTAPRRGTGPDEFEADEGLDEEDELEDDDDEEEDEDYEDEDDDDEEEDEEFEDADEEDEEEDEDEYEDDDEEEEDEDEEEGRLRTEPVGRRLTVVARTTPDELDDDAGDLEYGVDEDDFTEDDMDTDRVASYRIAA